ncbi:MAG: transposase family protein [Bacteroidetes bacterium]|nr:transposase family protein [Bacteroidota bacterium]
MQKNIRNRLNRESCIADEDIEYAVKQIIEYPFLGGKKGSLKLQHDEKAFIGSTTYQEIKNQLKTAVAKELLKRKEQSELEKDQYNRYREKKEPFIKVDPQKKHQVWAIDFLNILLFGIYFRICVVYDIFSQSYLSIKPSIHATSYVAEQALEQACQYSGQIPDTCLLSDNGSQFKCYSFEETKKRLKIQSRYIPRGQPWYNGALESGNRDLRKVIYTIAFYDACKDTQLTKAGVDYNKIYDHLQACCHKAITVINEAIVRPKFKTTPMAVLKDQVEEKQQQRIRFIEKKQQERKKRMQQLKANAGSNRKRIEDKAAASWKRVSRKLDTEQLFAFSEMINKRYKAIMI